MRDQSRYYRYFTYIKPIIRLPIVKTYGSAIFTIITITIFIFFAIKPTIETILILQKKIENSNQVLAKVNKKANDLSLGKTNYQNLDVNIKNKIQTAIPDSIDLKSVILNLEQAAKRNEASVSALQIQPLVIEPKKENVLGGLAEVVFTFNVEGSYRNLIALLQDLKSSARLMSIDGLALSKVSEGQGLVMSISGKAYYLK